MKLTVVDSIMGSGKTQKAIQIMSEEDNRVIYITPFLKEVQRIKEGVKNKTFYEPKQFGKGKLESLKQLIKQGKDIASTHALFATADDELMELIEMNGYILILDEVMDVISPINITKNDIRMLINEKKISIDDFGNVKWIEPEYNGKFNDLKTMAEHNRVIKTKSNLMLWMFPVDVFRCFEEVYILTYMFKGQIMKYYYDLYNVKYEYKSVRKINEEYEFVKYVDDKVEIVNLINILENEKLNKVGKENTALSFTWYEKAKDSYLDLLRNNLSNYFKNIMKAKSKEILWTVFLGENEKIRKKLQNKGYQSKKCFAPVTSRATNEYSDRNCLAYMANRFLNPHLKNFFTHKGAKVNEDMFALSEMLQWIFRSAIRNKEYITIYIPSKRMRELLINWIGDGQNPRNS